MRAYVCNFCGATLERDESYPVQLRIIKPERKRNEFSKVFGHVCEDCIGDVVEEITQLMEER